MLMMLKSEGITHKIKNVNFNIVVVVLCDIEINTDAAVSTWGWHSFILIPYLQCSYMCIMWIVREYGSENTIHLEKLTKRHTNHFYQQMTNFNIFFSHILYSAWIQIEIKRYNISAWSKRLYFIYFDCLWYVVSVFRFGIGWQKYLLSLSIFVFPFDAAVVQSKLHSDRFSVDSVHCVFIRWFPYILVDCT